MSKQMHCEVIPSMVVSEESMYTHVHLADPVLTTEYEMLVYLVRVLTGICRDNKIFTLKLYFYMINIKGNTIDCISSSVRVKSNTLAFSSILLGLEDFGIVVYPCCTPQRSITWATLLLHLKQKVFSHYYAKSLAVLFTGGHCFVIYMSYLLDIFVSNG